MRRSLKRTLAICATLLIFAGVVSPAQAQDPTPFANCRLGVGNGQDDVVGYDLEQLNTGLYLDWAARSTRPAGLPADIEYLQMVRVHQDKGDTRYGPPRVYASNTYQVSPSLTQIASIAASQPGSLWLIGNEIERVDWCTGWVGNSCISWSGQDEITPDVYARAFHEIQAIIKAADPTARVAIGSVIEATPLRLEYLDRVWGSYSAQYGYSMGNDIDVWNVHGFILREERGSWGAEIPAGLGDFGGFLYGADIPTIVAEHHNIARFQEFTVALRAWMAAHGERNKSLINTEYGILYTSLGGEQITPQQVKDYLTASFDYLLTITDDDIGFPADENRLVQGWVWYSVSDDNWNGNLFDPSTKALTEFGTTWRDYVSDPAKPLASQPQLNLLVTNLRASPNPFPVPPGGSRTVTLRVDVANSGNTKTTTGDNIVVKFWDGYPNAPGSNLIASRTLADIPGCGSVRTVEAEWHNRLASEYTWYAEVVPIAEEPNTNDNIDSHVISGFLANDFTYLPFIMR